MKYVIIAASLCLVVVYSYPTTPAILENEFGEQFYMVPLQRQRRDTTWDIAKQPTGGTRVTLGHEGVLADKGAWELTGGGMVSKQFDPSGPTTIGGSVGVHHIPTDSNIRATVAQTPQWGTDVGIEAAHTLWAPDKNTKLEAYGGASQHLGGPFGNSKPEANFGLQFSHGHDWFSG